MPNPKKLPTLTDDEIHVFLHLFRSAILSTLKISVYDEHPFFANPYAFKAPSQITPESVE
jgi:hypothetical protein